MTRLIPTIYLATAAFVILFWWGVYSVWAQVDLGGNIFEAWAKAQHNTSPITGTCASACTQRLQHARCVSPNALLGFHTVPDQLATQQILSTYRPALAAYVRENCSTVCWLRGADLTRFGYRLCQ